MTGSEIDKTVTTNAAMTYELIRFHHEVNGISAVRFVDHLGQPLDWATVVLEHGPDFKPVVTVRFVKP